MLLAADKVVTPERTLSPGWVEVSGPVIRTVGEGAPPSAPDHDFPGGVITPGFIDLHCHGGGGASFMDGPDAARVAREAHLQHGTTTMMASLVTDEVTRLAAVCGELAPLVEEGLLAGIHLEGPWLSPRQCGAHDPELLRDPTTRDIDCLRAAARGTIRMVTLAPERRGALEAVLHLGRHGVLPAIGHSDATYVEARAAILAGARVATHVYNAMRPFHHREPGIVGAAVTDPGIFVEAIADGIHLHPAILAQLLEKAKGRAVLVTDAMAAAAADDGRYRLGPLAVVVEDGVARLTSNGAIAGSTLTMDAAVRYAVRTAGVSLDDAVRAATMAPATVLGKPSLGRISPGNLADLAVLTSGLEVCGVLTAGHWARSPR